MFKNFQPLNNNVLIRKIEKEEKTPAGIIIPEAAKEKTQMGKILAIGNGKITSEGNVIPMQVSNDDVVFFGKYAGLEVGDSYIILKEDEILGIIKE